MIFLTAETESGKVRKQEYVPNDKQVKIIVREQNKTELSIMSKREFKIMSIKILTGLKKTVKDRNKTLNKETKHK